MLLLHKYNKNMKFNFENKTDEELAKLIANGDDVAALAFDEIYSRNSPKLYTYCRRIFENNQISQDIFQESFIKFYESCRKNHEMTNVAGFLIKIARNLSLNEKNRKKAEFVFIEDIDFPSYDNEYEVDVNKNIIDTALQSLPKKYREIIILKEYLDMTYDDIRKILDLTPSMVRIRIFRAKNKLRDLLAPYKNELNRKN